MNDRHGEYIVGTGPDDLRWLLAELGAHGLSGMFRRAQMAVHCSRIDEDGYLPPTDDRDDNGPATISPVTPDVLVARLALAYKILKSVGRGDNKVLMEALFPGQVAKLALAVLDQAPNLRALRGVTHTPMVRADGSIIGKPGYDDAAGFLYLPTVAVPAVPERPTAEQLAAATKLLRGLVDEFAWVGDHDEANFFGLMLLPLLRELCPPPYKLGAIGARQPGSGKSLLAEILRIVHGGVFRSEMPTDDAELAKALTSILTQTTAPVVTFDNVSGILRSSKLAGLLTSAEYSDRVLGSTNETFMVNDRLWTLTGNNLALGGDLIRRSLWVTIDPRVPNPESRTGFRIPSLPAYVAEYRGAILAALLTWVRGWAAAGATFELAGSDSYARSTGVVRGILQAAGVPGTFDHVDSRQQKLGNDDDEWRDFLLAIRGAFNDRAWTTKELLGKVHDGREPFGALVDSYGPEHPISLDAVPGELAEKITRARSTTAVARPLGMWLRNREGRWAGDVTVRRVGEERKGAGLWRVETFGEPRAGRAGEPW